MQVIGDLPIQQLEELINNGNFMLHSTQTAFMGLSYLRKNGML
jgi:hypothetical protein